MTGTTRPPGRPRSARADAAILRAALDLLVERGVEATSIERIAQRAGVTRATVYRRFPDKIQLLIAAIHSGYDLPAELLEVPEPENIEEMLSLWARAISVPDGGRRRRLMRRLMTSLYDYPELAAAYTEASIAPRNQAILAVLERSRERGEFPADADLDIVRQILSGAISTHLLTYPDDGTPRETEAYLLAVLRHTCYRPSERGSRDMTRVRAGPASTSTRVTSPAAGALQTPARNRSHR